MRKQIIFLALLAMLIAAGLAENAKICNPLELSGVRFDRMVYQNYGSSLFCVGGLESQGSYQNFQGFHRNDKININRPSC